MKELDPAVFLAVFEEMLGLWLWVGLAAAVASMLLFALVLLRERQLMPRRMLWSQAAGALGGAAAILILQRVTNSGFADIGGPIDWVVGIAVFAAGAVAALVGTYALLGVFGYGGRRGEGLLPQQNANPQARPAE
ncbi:MAG: DUF5368 domain-containing protein [Rhodovarius sp.]|nr:DUF5368 domain-containing protein [Rhodovarius sp.]